MDTEKQPRPSFKQRAPFLSRFIQRFLGPIPLYILFGGLVLLLNTDMTEAREDLLLDILFGLGLVVVVGICIRISSIMYGIYAISKARKEYSTDQETNTINACKPLSYSCNAKKPHVVILLHGFTSSPMIFDNLIEELHDNKIDYQAPLISGFGLIRHDLLFSLREEDWVRQVTELYDVLDSQYEKISVIGHSLGGLLAIYLSQIRPVNHLIVAAPAIFPDPAQRLYRFLSRSRVTAKVLSWTIPFLPKFRHRQRASSSDILNAEVSGRYFQYPVAPVRGVFSMLKLQDRVDFTKANFNTLDLLFGTQDLTVDGNKIWEHLKRLNIPHRIHRFDETAHNPFVDFEQELAGWIVIYILNDQLEWPPLSYVEANQDQSSPGAS